MLSLIICSRNEKNLKKLKENIQLTIGTEYELVLINNSNNNYSIFSAYNEGVRRAKYPYLCFMHEDILYHTKGWGKNLVDHFKDEKIGLIGVAGGHYMPDCPASWWSAYCVTEEYLQGKRVQTDDHGVIHYSSRKSCKDEAQTSVSAVAVDGFWFCIPRKLFEIIRFDDEYYKGWHAYDLDICMQVIDANYQVHVIFDILIEHFSAGVVNSEWLFALEKFHKKWTDKLPAISGLKLSDMEITDRKCLVEDNYRLQKKIFEIEAEIDHIHISKAYRLGKFILKPFTELRKVVGRLL